MIGNAQEGHPPVKRFVKGHHYHMIWPDGTERVLQFKKQTTVLSPKNTMLKIYHFNRVAEDGKACRVNYVGYRGSTVKTLKIRHIIPEDLLLYVGRDNTYPALVNTIKHLQDKDHHRKEIIKNRYRKKPKNNTSI